MKRHYGDDGTIHQTGSVDVGVDKDGKVVAVWFRCAMLPFIQYDADADGGMVGRGNPEVSITAIEWEED